MVHLRIQDDRNNQIIQNIRYPPNTFTISIMGYPHESTSHVKHLCASARKARQHGFGCWNDFGSGHKGQVGSATRLRNTLKPNDAKPNDATDTTGEAENGHRLLITRSKPKTAEAGNSQHGRNRNRQLTASNPSPSYVVEPGVHVLEDTRGKQRPFSVRSASISNIRMPLQNKRSVARPSSGRVARGCDVLERLLHCRLDALRIFQRPRGRGRGGRRATNGHGAIQDGGPRGPGKQSLQFVLRILFRDARRCPKRRVSGQRAFS